MNDYQEQYFLEKENLNLLVLSDDCWSVVQKIRFIQDSKTDSSSLEEKIAKQSIAKDLASIEACIEYFKEIGVLDNQEISDLKKEKSKKLKFFFNLNDYAK